MTKAPESERWDFFVSYTQVDRQWAEWVAWQLEEDGYQVLIEAWDFVGGTNWIHKMQKGITGSDRMLAVLSDAYLESVYGSAEWQAVWAADPTGETRKLLTARVTDCARPGLLTGVAGTDLFGASEATARQRLRQLVRGALAGRAKPATPPPFPPTARAVPHEAPFPGTMARIWNVPPRNPNFTGRADALDTLARALDGDSAVTVSAVHGMGGVGKTQLVNEYVHAHPAKYELVWWIAAETTETIPDQFAALATRLGMEPDADPDSIRTAVHEQLRQVHGWVLVFDNTNSVADVQNWIPTFPQPAGVPGHVVVTTRRGGFKGLGEVLDLDVLEPEAAVALIRTRVPNIEADAAAGIADFLGNLPLALEQAAAYLDTTGMPASEYLTLLRSRTEELISRGLVADKANPNVATLWDISLDQINSHSPAAVQLLDLCAYLAPEAIPLDLFTSHPDLLPGPLSQAVADPLQLADVLATLADFSLAKRTSSGLQMHRLVQATIRATLGGSSCRENADSTVSDENALDSGPLADVLRLLQADAPSQIMSAPENWPRWVCLLPHVLAATEHYHTVQGGLSLGAWAAWLLDRGGTYLQVHGRAYEARPLFERALIITEATYGLDHSTVAVRLNNLAVLVRELGEPAEARPLAERALAIGEAVDGPDHPVVAIRLSNLAMILRDLGEAAEARPLVERALAITEATYGPDHPNIATSLSYLAMLMRNLGASAAARPLAERALAITEATYGPDHPDVAASLSYLAILMRDLGEPAAARPLAERALAITEATYGPDHPEVATRLNNLAMLLSELGEPAAARPLAERALAITEATYGPDHPDVATRLSNLATLLSELGEPTAARPLAERALAITEATYGPDHPNIATTLSNLAVLLSELGEPAAARPLAERALAITEATYGPDHPDVAIRLSNLAMLLSELGRPAEARPLAERALAMGERTYGPDHPDVAIRLSNLAMLMRELDEPAEARTLAERALAITEATYGLDHPLVAIRLKNLAILMREMDGPIAGSPPNAPGHHQGAPGARPDPAN